MALYSHSNARQSLIDTVSFRAASQIATVLGYIVMVRAMTVEDFGVFNLLYAFIPVAATMASFGLEQTLRRFQPEYLRAGNSSAAAWLVRFVASARFGTNVLFIAIVLFAWNQVAPIFKLAPYRNEFAFFCLLLVLHFQTGIMQFALASRMLHRYSVGSVAVLSIAKFAGYSLFAWLHALTIPAAILVDTVAYACAWLFLNVAYRRQVSGLAGNERFRPAPEERKRLVRYGFFNSFNDIGNFALSTRSDAFFIAAFINPVSVGIYAFYNRINEMVSNLMPVRLFDNVIQPMFFAMAKSEADWRAPQYFSLLLNMNLLVQWPILTFATAYHAELVQFVFGGKFIEYSWLFPVVVAFTTINCISVPVTLVAQYEEKAGLILIGKVFAIYNIAALLVLLPIAGLYGAAFANGSSQTLKNLFIWWNVRHRARWLNAGAALLGALLLWGVTLAACYGLKRLLPAYPLVQMLAGAVVIGGAALVHVRSAAISATDRRILGTILRGKEAAFLQRLGLLRKADKEAPAA